MSAMIVLPRIPTAADVLDAAMEALRPFVTVGTRLRVGVAADRALWVDVQAHLPEGDPKAAATVLVEQTTEVLLERIEPFMVFDAPTPDAEADAGLTVSALSPVKFIACHVDWTASDTWGPIATAHPVPEVWREVTGA